MLYSLLKGLLAIWPFLKEVVLGNADLKEVVRKNKIITAMTVLNILLFLMFLYMADKVISYNTAAGTTYHQRELMKYQLEVEQGKVKTLSDDLELERTRSVRFEAKYAESLIIVTDLTNALLARDGKTPAVRREAAQATPETSQIVDRIEALKRDEVPPASPAPSTPTSNEALPPFDAGGPRHR